MNGGAEAMASESASESNTMDCISELHKLAGPDDMMRELAGGEQYIIKRSVAMIFFLRNVFGSVTVKRVIQALCLFHLIVVGASVYLGVLEAERAPPGIMLGICSYLLAIILFKCCQHETVQFDGVVDAEGQTRVVSKAPCVIVTLRALLNYINLHKKTLEKHNVAQYCSETFAQNANPYSSSVASIDVSEYQLTTRVLPLASLLTTVYTSVTRSDMWIRSFVTQVIVYTIVGLLVAIVMVALAFNPRHVGDYTSFLICMLWPIQVGCFVSLWFFSLKVMSEAFLVLKLRIKLLSASERIICDLPGLYDGVFSDVNGLKKEYVLMKTCVGLFSRQFQFGIFAGTVSWMVLFLIGAVSIIIFKSYIYGYSTVFASVVVLSVVLGKSVHVNMQFSALQTVVKEINVTNDDDFDQLISLLDESPALYSIYGFVVDRSTITSFLSGVGAAVFFMMLEHGLSN